MSRPASEKLKAACITVLGAGYLRPAPGTWGSAVAVVAYGAIWCLAAGRLRSQAVLEALTLMGIFASSAICVFWGRWAIERFAHIDPREFVLDEFAGQWVALLALPVGPAVGWWALAGVVGGQFLLFRAMDIVKPPPAYQLQRLPAGWGILVDDLFAGAYANVVGQLIWRLTPLAAWLGVELGHY